MQRKILIFVALLFAVVTASETNAQTRSEERANELRERLIEVKTQKEDLETRLKELEEELKPENIEKSLAGIGSTRPEGLRELRRRELEVEKTSIQTQLQRLTENERRLEARILQADNAAYHEGAGVDAQKSSVSVSEQKTPAASRPQRRVRKPRVRSKRRPVYRQP
jgi:hypothetical protein